MSEEQAFIGEESIQTPLGTETFVTQIDGNSASEKELRQPESLWLKERNFEYPEEMSDRDSSKRYLQDERDQLARSIKEERQINREKLAALRVRLTMLSSSLSEKSVNLEEVSREYERLNAQRAEEANSIAHRVRGMISRYAGVKFQKDQQREETVISLKEERERLVVETETVNEEILAISDLVDGDGVREDIKNKLTEHYMHADSVAREKMDQILRSVAHVSSRNNAFIVHIIAEAAGIRHNENSNISGDTNYEDDVDILLALEPSVSASSVTPGERDRLWPGASGFLFGGGDIGEVGHTDIGTQPNGIKSRGGNVASLQDIDEVVSRKYGHESGYNEIVVNNPEAAGFFQHAESDEEGRFWAYSREIKKLAEKALHEGPPGGSTELLKVNIGNYRKRFEVARARGLPLFIMTPDRRVFECIGVMDDGSLEIGKEFSPEEVAVSRAGLLPEKRKEIGERLLRRNLFRSEQDSEEARGVIDAIPDAPPQFFADPSFPGAVVVRMGKKGYALRSNERGGIEGNQINYLDDNVPGAVYKLSAFDIETLRARGILEQVFPKGIEHEREEIEEIVE